MDTLEVSGVRVTFEQLEQLVQGGSVSVQDAQKALLYPATIVADDMKLTSKNLGRVLKDTFDESLIITGFNKKEGLVQLTWVPEKGPTEYGQFSYYDSTKTSVKVHNTYPASFDAWTKIFRVIDLFFHECDSCLYMIRFTDWDGTTEHLFETYKTLRIQHDPIDDVWISSIDNPLPIGPILHRRTHEILIDALCEVLTDMILFEEWSNERPESEQEWNDLTNFHEWKKYKVSA